MKKEKWLLREIESWIEKEIVSEETADNLKTMYQPKKSINLLMVLFSIIGSILIGMGIVLVSANNWWYSLPIPIRTFIGFLPLLISQIIVLFVYRYKINSTAFRESAALLNMAGVFASIALVGQIFHLPGDFTNYLLVCGVLFLPTMVIMNAFSPLIIYYWTAINGGIYFSDKIGIIISVLMFTIGAVFALSKCSVKNGKSIYLSIITVISAFVLILASALECYGELSIILYAYALLLLSASSELKGSEDVFEAFGRICFIVLTLVVTYQELWNYNVEFDNKIFLILTIMLILLATVFFAKNVMSKKYSPFSIVTFVLLIFRVIWGAFGLAKSPFDEIFMVASNVILLALSVFCIFDGARKIDLYNANIGMVTLCTLIIMRFLDSELPLSARGVIFLILGTGFLLFNLYLVKTKKSIKEDTT